jgi:GNAT superfamily N-acetyltransferase
VRLTRSVKSLKRLRLKSAGRECNSPRGLFLKIVKPKHFYLLYYFFIIYINNIKMNKKALEIVADLNPHWKVLPVKNQEDIASALALYAMFNEYTGQLDDKKISQQRQKMESQAHRYFLLKPRTNDPDSSAGYYAADLQNQKYSGGILLDQIFIHPEHRGRGLGTFLTSHFLFVVAELYYDAKTTGRPAPKRIIVEHFRQQSTPNSDSLESIKRTLKGFGFCNLPQNIQPLAPNPTFL